MNARTTSSVDASPRYLPALLLLFVGSGCAALIYEIVWFQLLQLVIGSSAVSLGVLLGTFMGGMCLGSLLLPRYIDAKQHPLRVYAFLELGIGAFGSAVALRDAARQHDLRRRSAAASFMRARRRGDLPAAADAADGRDAAGHGALGRDDAEGRVVARLLLRRQHRRRRHRQPARRLLPAARLRRDDRDLRRGRAQRGRRVARAAHRGQVAVRPRPPRRRRPRSARGRLDGASTSRSRCRE